MKASETQASKATGFYILLFENNFQGRLPRNNPQCYHNELLTETD